MEDQGEYNMVEKVESKKKTTLKLKMPQPNPPLLIPKNFRIRSGKIIHSTELSFVASFDLDREIEGRQVFVIKRINLSIDDNYSKTAFRELGNLLAAKGHKHIVKLISAYSPEKWSEGPSHLTQLYLVFPHIETDLREFIKIRQEKRGLTHVAISRITAQLIDALIYLHEKCHVIHRDLKPMNVGVEDTSKGDSELFVVLIDFGLSRACHPDDVGGLQRIPNSVCRIGTPVYCSPEIFMGLRIGTPTDVWSLGCILGEMTQKEKAVFPPRTINVFGSIRHFDPIWQLENILSRVNLIDEKWYEEPSNGHDFSPAVIECLKKRRNLKKNKVKKLVRKRLYIKGGNEGDRNDENLMDLLKALLNPNPDERMTLRQACETAYIKGVGHDFEKNLKPTEQLYTAKDDDSADQSQEHWKGKICDILKGHPKWKTMYGPSTEQDSQAGSSKA